MGFLSNYAHILNHQPQRKDLQLSYCHPSLGLTLLIFEMGTILGPSQAGTDRIMR